MQQIPFIICSHPKDHAILSYVVRGLETSLKDFNIPEIIIITPEPVNSYIQYKLSGATKIRYILDKDIPIDTNKINFRSPGWIKQQLIKLLAGEFITDAKIWGVVDSDTILRMNILNSNDRRSIFYHSHDQYHEPYYLFQEKLLGTKERHFHRSFIAELMFFNKQYIRGLIGDAKSFLDFCYKTIDDSCYLSEYELYGNYVCKIDEKKENIFHYNLRNYHFDKINQDWTPQEIETIWSMKNSEKLKDYDTITVNSIRW